MQKLFLSALLACFALTAQGANVFFQFGNPTNGLPYLSEVTLTATNTPTAINGTTVINEVLKFKTDVNGQLTVTNLQPLRYRVHFALAGKNTTTDFEITLTNSLSDPSTIAASSIITAPTNSSPSGTVAYSKAATDALLSNRVPLYGASATTNVGLLASIVFHTNYTRLQTPFTITGSSLAGINGTYALAWTNNSVSPFQAVWTNTVNTNIVYLNDPGGNVFAPGFNIERMTNDPAFLYNTEVLAGNIPNSGWTPINGPGGDVVVTGYTTNTAITALQVLSPTNATILSTSPAIRVDPVNGNDNFANRTNGLAFATFSAACAVATNNDIINAVTANYSESSGITVPTNVTINFNHSWVTNVLFTFTSGNKINDLNTYVAPHFACTNTNSITVVRNLYSYGVSGDGILIDTNNSSLVFWDSDLGSPWDSAIIQGTSTNSLIQFNNVRFASVANPLQPMAVTWGFHAIGWAIGANGGGKLELNNCTLLNLNSTNLTFAGSFMLGNSCIQICNTGSGTNFHNASLALNNCALSYGSTNAGVVAVGITNTLGIPTSGSYLSSAGAVSVTAPPLSSTNVYLSGVLGNGSGWTNLNGANLTSGTVNSNALDTATKAQLALATAPIVNSFNYITNAGFTASTNVAYQSGTNLLSGTNNFSGAVIATNAANTIAGNGPNLAYLPAYPAPWVPGSYGRAWLVQREYPNAASVIPMGMSTATPTGTLAAFPPVAGLPLGLQASVAAGGVYGLNLATPTEIWSTNNFIGEWTVSYTSDVSNNRLFFNLSNIATAGLDNPIRTVGFVKPGTNTHWFAYSNDSTVTNMVDTGVTAVIGTPYFGVVAKTNTTVTWYFNGALVTSGTWNPTAIALRHGWGGNALGSQAAGVVFHDYFLQHTP